MQKFYLILLLILTVNNFLLSIFSSFSSRYFAIKILLFSKHYFYAIIFTLFYFIFRFALLTACADGGLAHACILERYTN
jgi:hypothetical protein